MLYPTELRGRHGLGADADLPGRKTSAPRALVYRRGRHVQPVSSPGGIPNVIKPLNLARGARDGILAGPPATTSARFWVVIFMIVPRKGDRPRGRRVPGTPMAFDIAALQHIYGANLTYRSGNSNYTLPAVEDDGTFWTAIWDTGGVDLIRHTGSEAATIDLRAAPLTGQTPAASVERRRHRRRFHHRQRRGDRERAGRKRGRYDQRQ